MTLIGPVIKGLRAGSSLDLFRHLETRPSSFYDRVGRGAHHDPGNQRCRGSLRAAARFGHVGRRVRAGLFRHWPSLAIDVQLTLMLAAGPAILAMVTYFFRRKTRFLFRQTGKPCLT